MSSNGDTRELALWGGVAAFFGNLLAVKGLGLMLAEGNVRLGISALVTSLVVGGVVYAKIRRDAAARRAEK